MLYYLPRIKNRKIMKFDVEVLTPMFLGGAQEGKAELRVPSIKGALRFWWRALYGSEHLVDMKTRENAIFGSTNEKSSFSLSITGLSGVRPVLKRLPRGRMIPVESKGRRFKISIIDYLAYGLHKYNKQKKDNVYIREHIPPGTRFTLIMRINNIAPKDQLLQSLAMLVRYGGLGARSRNGFGSIHIAGLPDPLKAKGDVKPFTALSSKTILFDRFTSRDTWEDALSDIGEAYRMARTALEKKHVFQKRPLIAKPLIVKGKVDIRDRHSKPYFLHVSKTNNNKFKGQILFVPYRYHDASKLKEYFEACQRMNEVLSRATGGAR